MGTKPTVPQTETALSPKLLDILQYRESTRERTPSNATITSDDRRTTVGLSEGPTSASAHQTSKQQTTGRIMQRSGPVDKIQQGPSLSPPSGSAPASTTGNEPWHPTETTFRDRTNLDHGLKPVDTAWNSPEAKLPILRMLVRPDGSVSSNSSILTIVDGSENHSVSVDSVINRGVGGTSSSRGSVSSRNNRGDSDRRKSNKAKTPRSRLGQPGKWSVGQSGKRSVGQPGKQSVGQPGKKSVGQPGKKSVEQPEGQPGRPPRLTRAYSHDPPARRRLTGIQPFPTSYHSVWNKPRVEAAASEGRVSDQSSLS